MWIHPIDAARFHKVSRMIEDDLHEAYLSCRTLYGGDVAGSILVCLLRQKMNDQPNVWPPPEDLVEKVNSFLRAKGLM